MLAESLDGLLLATVPIIIIMVGPTIQYVAENSCFSILYDCMLNASRYENGRWSDHPEIPDSRLRRRDGDRSIVLLMNILNCTGRLTTLYIPVVDGGRHER